MAQYRNKIIYGGEVLIDLTGDTATQNQVLKGYTIHDMTGAPVTGTCTYDSDTTDATVTVGEMLSGKTAYARGAKISGNMPNNGSINGAISAVSQQFTIPQGYHDGGGFVAIDTNEQAKIIGDNIRKGVSILGVIGSMDEDNEDPEPNKIVIPSSVDQNITPSANYTCFREVVVKAIPYTEELNAAGGYTVTIG